MSKLVLFEAYVHPSAKKEADGVETLPLKNAAKLARTMKAEKVLLEVRAGKVTATLIAGKQTVQVKGAAPAGLTSFSGQVDSKDFRELSKLKGKQSTFNVADKSVFIDGREVNVLGDAEDVTVRRPRNTAPANSLLSAIQAASEHIGTAARYDFDKILLDPDGTNLRVVASDKNTMYHHLLKNGAEDLGIKKSVLLPWSKALASTVFTKAEDVQFTCNSQHVTLIAGNVLWQHKIEPGRFPLYKEILDNAVSSPACHVPEGSFGAVDEWLKEAEKKSEPVKILFTPDKPARLSLGTQEAGLAIPVRGYSGKLLKIAFNPRYLKRGLDVPGLKSISVPEFDYKPVAFNNGTVTAVVMPCGV